MKYKLYEVGGKIRDEILGIKSKDVDYTVVMEGNFDDPFEEFVKCIEEEGFEIFLKTKNCATIRAKFPKGHKYKGVADFVLARKEIGYIEGTRTPIMEYGTLADDLIRRDFTINALAKDESGTIIDLHNGVRDLRNGVLRTPTDACVTFNDDPLRILRAYRFSITKGLDFSDQVRDGIRGFNGDFSVVSPERISDEFNKMFNFDTYKTIIALNSLKDLNYPLFLKLFPKGWKLQMTNKKC